ncbi:MAG TPA: potassium-transporting ATPase subunit KdpA [Gammaproteobacteria bacterium]|jgi:K+-transporting ATPase ATPase A chain|nr:potassium-transporting ATPase subunit KdpA [Gammaproteobacteria bacterium]
MTAQAFLQVAIYVGVLVALVKPLGIFMAHVYEGKHTFLSPALGPVERLIYRVAGVDAARETDWKRYTVGLLLFNLIGVVVVYLLQRFQGLLPLNPAGMPAVSPDSSFNTAVSFATNTNWQGYAGEATMSYLTQMLGLAVQNFVSAASGMAVLVALTRGFVRRQSAEIGNFWVDLTRSTLYILLPLSLLLAIVLMSQGVVQTFAPYKNVELVDPITVDMPIKNDAGDPVLDATGKPATQATRVTEQTLPLGPAASQVAIKQLGTNGGGFFNVNSAHPYENPTPLSNFLEVLAILLISASLCYTFGYMVRDTRQGWALLAAMLVIFVPLVIGDIAAEQAGNPRLEALQLDQSASDLQAGGNMEGKETRFGVTNSALWAVATTAASNGSVNAMHDSFTPLGGMIPMWLMQLGEVVFGGVGSGLYGMLMFAIVAVFIAGLMVGRTPEYLGKKLESYEIKMASLAILVPPAIVLVGAAIASVLPVAVSSIANPAVHGFSEILYAFSSAGNNNGSAFAGISANVPFYNVALGIAMWLSRYWIMIPVLGIAGSLAAKRSTAVTAGTLPTHTPLFIGWLVGVVLMVGALTFVPALALGPIVEHLQMIGRN